MKSNQNILHKAIEATNNSLSESIIAPFEITREDEIAIIDNLTPFCFSSIIEFVNHTYSLKIRWAVVIEEIT